MQPSFFRELLSRTKRRPTGRVWRMRIVQSFVIGMGLMKVGKPPRKPDEESYCGLNELYRSLSILEEIVLCHLFQGGVKGRELSVLVVAGSGVVDRTALG